MNSRKEFLERLLDSDNWTESDKQQLLHYLDGGDLQELEQLAREKYNSSFGAGDNVLTAQQSEHILQNIHRQITVARPAKVKLFNLYRLTAAAALVVIIAGIGLLNKDAIINFLRPVNMLQAYTGNNEVKTLNLSDGSVVRMEANSMVVYPEKFTGATRDITLHGEAFFEVAKDHTHPFIVHSPLVNTTVVGTEFDVDDKDSVNAKVLVVSGIVKVQVASKAQKQEVKLTPTEGAVYGTGNKLLAKIISPDDARYYRQRRDGKFVYDGVPVSVVAKDVARFYKTNVTVGESMSSRVFYGSFKTDDSLTTVLNIMAISMNAVMQQSGDKRGYTLTCTGCSK